MEVLHNNYVKIKPIRHDSFIPTENPTYQELGIVLAKDKKVLGLKVGDKVKFDRFLAFKIPIEGKDDEFEWYVKMSEIISSENVTEPIRKI